MQLIPCLLFPLLIIFGAWIASYILSPIERAVRSNHTAVQFQLIDLISLVVLLQFALAVPAGVIRRTEPLFWGTVAFGSISAVAMWWGGLRTMFRAGVQGWGRRAIFIVYVLPMTLVLIIANVMFPGVIITTIFIFVSAVGNRSDLTMFSSSNPIVLLGGVSAAAVGDLAFVLGTRRCVLWIIQSESNNHPKG